MSQHFQPLKQNAAHDLPIEPSIRTFAQSSMFWQPEYRHTSLWLEHLPFLFWLVEALKPANSVVAGVDLVPHFAICQAIARLSLGGHSYVIGEANDEQARRLAEEATDQYAGISHWLNVNPTLAIQQFNEDAIDLLMLNIAPEDDTIDSLVGDWLARLSSRSVILLPGIARREPGCKAFHAFEALSSRYPHLAFYHGAGLGLLAVGKDMPPLVSYLLESCEAGSSTQVVQDVFGRLGGSCQDKVTAQQQQARAKLLETRLSEQTEELSAVKQCSENVSQQLEASVRECAALQAENAQWKLQYQALESEQKKSSEEVATLTQQLAGKERALTEKHQQNAQLIDYLQEQKASLEARFNELGLLTRKQQETEHALNEAECTLSAAQKARDAAEQHVAKYKKELSDLTLQLNASAEHKKELLNTVETHCRELAVLNDLLETNDAHRKELLNKLNLAEQDAKQSHEIQAQQADDLKRQSYELAKLVAQMEALRAVSPSNSEAYHEAASRPKAPPSGHGVSKAPPLTKRAIKRQIALIEASQWFDGQWYLAQYPDIAADPKMSAKPARHYLLMGGFEGRNPCSGFDSAYYLLHNPDVVESGINPLVHYLKFGEKEQRSTKGH